jgi:uncharacterized protein (TIGR02300 family)
VANPKLGTKRICPETGRKFYDLGKDPIVSPYTGTSYPRSAFEKAPERAKTPVAAAPVAKAAVVTEAVVEREPDVISLEDAEVVVDDDAAVESDEAVIADAEVEVEDDAEPAPDDTFLEEEEEEGAVTDLLDVDAESEEER